VLRRPALALGLTIAVSAACAKHEKAPPAASSNTAAAAPTAPAALAAPAAPDAAEDPKEAARASGLLGPTDQGAFADDFEAGSAASKPAANAKGGHADSDKKATPGPKTVAPNAHPSPGSGPEHAGQGAADHGGGGGGGGTRGPETINGSVAIADISAGDDTAKDPVRAAVAKHLGAIETCYRETLARAPAVGGKFKVVFFVDPDGTFERADKLSSELGDGLLADCVIRTVNGIKLDHQLGGTQPIKVGVVLSFKHT
jgi:hypothetical protein